MFQLDMLKLRGQLFHGFLGLDIAGLGICRCTCTSDITPELIYSDFTSALCKAEIMPGLEGIIEQVKHNLSNPNGVRIYLREGFRQFQINSDAMLPGEGSRFLNQRQQ
jgi:hypothetical protein